MSINQQMYSYSLWQHTCVCSHAGRLHWRRWLRAATTK